MSNVLTFVLKLLHCLRTLRLYNYIVLCGDSNCHSDSQFSGLYTDLINNLNLIES